MYPVIRRSPLAAGLRLLVRFPNIIWCLVCIPLAHAQHDHGGGGGVAPAGPVMRWSDAATWAQPGFGIVGPCSVNPGEVCSCPPKPPTAGKTVTIPSGATVLLDVDTPVLSGLNVLGKLVFEDKPGVGLSAHWVMVMGAGAELQVGSEMTPFVNRTHITLHGTDRNLNVSGEPAPWTSGNKFLMAMDGGTLRLHGASRSKVSWTKLNAYAPAGATTMTLARADTGWQVGDKLVVAGSGYLATEAQEVTITAISGASVSFTPALTYQRWGSLQTFGGETIDERAPVGLLTRNILVQGAADSEAQKFGAHLMIMGGLAGRPKAYGYVEGVEIYRGGQAGKQGRYSFHWHWVGPGDGQYFRNNSVHHGFQRAANIHRTSGVLVADNVAYRIPNHNYVWAEDGHATEFNNTLRGNLAVHVIHPSPEEFAFGERDSGGINGQPEQEEWRSSAFWGRTMGNTLEGNHASGVMGGMGYFFDIGGSVGVDGTRPYFRFDNNEASACTDVFSGLAPQNDLYPPLIRGAGLFVSGRDAGLMEFTGFKAFKTKLGVWMEASNHTLRNAKLSNNAGAMFCLTSRIHDSLIVGSNANTQGYNDVVRLNPVTQIGHVGVHFSGVLTFGGQGGAKMVKARNIRAFNVHSAITLADSGAYHGGYFTGVSATGGLPVYGMNLGFGAILDLDGQFDPAGQNRPTWLTFGDPWFIHPSSKFDAASALWRTPEPGKIVRTTGPGQFQRYGATATGVTVIENGLGVRATGNGGWALPFDYNVTPNTMIEFFALEYTINGDKHWHYAGIGLDEDLNTSNGKRLFGLFKWEGDPGNNNRAFPAYTDAETKPFQLPNQVAEPGRVYRIPVGQFYTGPMRYLVFYGDASSPTSGLANYDVHMIRVFERNQGSSRGWFVRREIFDSVSPRDGVLTFADLEADSRYPNRPDRVQPVNPYYGTYELHDDVVDNHRSAYQVQRKTSAAVDKTYLVVPTNGLYEFAIESGMTNFKLEIGIIRSTGLTWTKVLEENAGTNSNQTRVRRTGSMNLRASTAYPMRITTLSTYAATDNAFRFQWKKPGDSAFSDMDPTFLRPAASDLRTDSNFFPDADNDGLDDGWELSFGLDNLSATGRSGPQESAAGDGVSNLAKYAFGMSPLVASLAPVTDVVPNLTTRINTVTFPGLRGRRYQLEKTSDFVTWTPVGAPVTTGSAESAVLSWQDSMGTAPQVFYRVQVSVIPGASVYVPPVTGGPGGGPSYP